MIGVIKKIVCLFFLMLMLESQAWGHGVSVPVIVDTDMALDDIRAIAMLLNSEIMQAPLYVVSDGVRPPQEGVRNLKAILKYFNSSDTQVVEGIKLNKPAPEIRNLMRDIKIPGMEEISSVNEKKKSAPEEIVRKIRSTNDSFIYLCLGPLTNLAQALKIEPEIKDMISFLIFYGGHPDDKNPGWNSLRDPEAARAVFDSGIRIYSIILPEEDLLPFNRDLYGRINGLKTPASSLVEKIHENDDIRRLLDQDHFYIWDEMTIIYFNDPSLFTFSLMPGRGKVMSLSGINREGVEQAYLQALGFASDHHLSPRQSVMLNDFPRDPEMFQKDVGPYVDRIIKKYGMEEWKACLLTNEFHRHLGIYSIIGAKMGVRAREILEAPFDTLEIISHAGSNPPLSCMNDGLQVSTGASLGRGAIRVLDKESSPSAIFVYNNIRLRLTLKNTVWEKVKKDLSELVKKYGGMNAAYFDHVRRLSVQYWMDLDRSNIFDENME